MFSPIFILENKNLFLKIITKQRKKILDNSSQKSFLKIIFLNICPSRNNQVNISYNIKRKERVIFLHNQNSSNNNLHIFNL